jgi:hypothetical protein
MPRNLYEQMSRNAREALAIVLGFSIPAETAAKGYDVDNVHGWSGFRNNLQDIACLPAGFTIGDALRAYCAHVISKGI